MLMLLKIQNDFDPVLSPESSLFVLKSKKQVSYQDILKVLDASKACSCVQNFTDVYLRLPGIPLSGQLTEGECIRVRICEGRFALLIREPKGKEILLSSQRLILTLVPALSQDFLSLVTELWHILKLLQRFTKMERFL